MLNIKFQTAPHVSLSCITKRNQNTQLDSKIDSPLDRHMCIYIYIYIFLNYKSSFFIKSSEKER